MGNAFTVIKQASIFGITFVNAFPVKQRK